MSATTGFIGAGAIDISVKNNSTGVWGGWFPIANVEKVEYTANSTVEKIISMSEATHGQSFDSASISMIEIYIYIRHFHSISVNESFKQ